MTPPRAAGGGRGRRGGVSAPPTRRVRPGRRGTSEVLGYVLGLGVMSLVLLTLFGLLAGGVAEQTEAAALGAGADAGQQVGRGIERVDRLARQSAGGGPIARRVPMPDRLAGRGYTVTVYGPADAAGVPACGTLADAPAVGCVVVAVGDRRVATHYTVAGGTTVETATLDGGPLRVVRPEGAGRRLVVREVAS